MTSIFLTAEWRHLLMINYQVDPALLKPFIPKGTELDLWQGKAYVSLVGFLFSDTRLFGIPVPFHRNFEEINLRFYIKRGGRHAVAFIQEIVPKWAIAALARTLYNENYAAFPMSHRIEQQDEKTDIEYRWQQEGKWQTLGATTRGVPEYPSAGSFEAFISEHYWGYAAQKNGGTLEYQVTHPGWRVWRAEELKVEITPFAAFLKQPPCSAFVAEGSRVSVFKPLLI